MMRRRHQSHAAQSIARRSALSWSSILTSRSPWCCCGCNIASTLVAHIFFSVTFLLRHLLDDEDIDLFCARPAPCASDVMVARAHQFHVAGRHQPPRFLVQRCRTGPRPDGKGGCQPSWAVSPSGYIPRCRWLDSSPRRGSGSPSSSQRLLNLRRRR